MHHRQNPFVLLGLAVVLAGCATAPSGPKLPVVVLLPAYVSPGLADGTAAGRRFLEIASRALTASGRYSIRTKGWFESGFDGALAGLSYARTALLDDREQKAVATALKVGAVGLSDLVADGKGTSELLTFRIVDAGSGVVLASWSSFVPLGREAWAFEGLRAWLTSGAEPQPSGPTTRADPAGNWDSWWSLAPELPPETATWRALLDQARADGNYDEARRLLDLVLDRIRDPRDKVWTLAREQLRRQLQREDRMAREDRAALSLAADLAGPVGTPADEDVLMARFLDRIRDLGPLSAAGTRDEVLSAFRSRFGQDLAVMLTRPPLVFVAGGSFSMGSTDGEADEKPVRQVTVGSLLVGRTEVTQDQYTGITGSNPSLFTQTADAGRHPVERVTWFDAVEYCNTLSARDGLEAVYTLAQRNPAEGYPIKSAEVTQDRTKDGYRLPTEAEWEWAARGGALSKGSLLAGGNDPALVAWTDGSTGGPGAVATKEPNELGLYDLSGNVWEWCWDWYGKYKPGAQVDPEGPSQGILRVGRGGSWHAAAWNARVTDRSYDNPGARANNLGFRVVRTVSHPSGE